MDSDIAFLTNKLDEAAALLDNFGQAHWAEWLYMDAQRIRKLDFYGIEHLLSAYGGMGSIRDVVLQIRDRGGLYLPPEENERFDFLRSEIYSIATRLKSEEF